MPDTLTPAELAEGLAKGEAAGWRSGSPRIGNQEAWEAVCSWKDWVDDHGETALRELAAAKSTIAGQQVIIAGQLKAMGRLRRKVENCRKELRAAMSGEHSGEYVKKLEARVTGQRAEINRLIKAAECAQRTSEFAQRQMFEAREQLAAEREKRAALVAEWRASDERDPWSNGYAKAADQLAALDKPEGA